MKKKPESLKPSEEEAKGYFETLADWLKINSSEYINRFIVFMEFEKARKIFSKKAHDAIDLWNKTLEYFKKNNE